MVKKTKDKAFKTIFWWIVWIVLTIASFFVAAALWTPIIAKNFGSVYETRASIIWIIAVFGTWMVFLVPLIIFMYQKVDKAYEDARLRRENAAQAFRSILIDKSERTLPASLAKKIAAFPQAIDGGHLVSVILKDGSKYPHVFVQNSEEVLGIYDQRDLPFNCKAIEDVEPTNLSNLPQFLPSNWLRLDGVKAPV